MNQALNLGMAKISLILGILLSIKYVIRIINKNVFNNKSVILKKINKILGKLHKPFGIAIIVTGLIHGLNSSYAVISLNLGTVCWEFSILLAVNFFLRKKFKTSKPWIYYHRVLTLMFIVSLIIHIILVK